VILYRERADLRRPPAMVARAVDEAFEGDARSGEDGDLRRWRSGGRLFARRATLDPAAGELRVAFEGPDAYRYLAPTGLVAAPALAWAAPTGLALAVATTVYALLAVAPGVHYLPGVPALPAVDGVETVVQRPTALAAPAYLVVGAALFVDLGVDGPRLGGAAAALVFVGLAAVHLASAREAAPGVPAAGVVLAGLVPAVLSGANVLVATAVLDPTGEAGADPWALVAVLAVAVVVDAVFFVYCRWVAADLARARPAPVEDRRWRTLGLGAVVLANLAVLAATVAGARTLVGDGGSLSGLLAPAGPFAPVLATAVGAVLLGPALVTAAGWVHHLLTAAGARPWALLRSTPVDLPGVPAGVSVRVVDTAAPVARPLWLPGRPVVLVGRPLADELDGRALAAVACHEAYHLVGDDPATGPTPWLVGALVGGPNAVRVLYDRATVERRADDFAADRVGADALARAVRTAGRLHLAAAGTDDWAADPDRDEGLRDRLARGLMAPYQLYFGDVAPSAHDPVTERVARLRGRAAGTSDAG
jgi:hypothetical protein